THGGVRVQSGKGERGIAAAKKGAAVGDGSAVNDSLLIKSPSTFIPTLFPYTTLFRSINSPRKAGFTLVEIMIVVAIIGLLAAIEIGNLIKASAIRLKNGCMANVKKIDGAIGTWALEQQKSNGNSVDPNALYGAYNYIK